MPWTKITRAQYLRNGLRYASDMTDAEWRLIARKLPTRRRLGRPRKVDLRKVVEAVLFILSTGCQWSALPREFPPYSTVQGYFYAWRDTRRWHRIVKALVRQARRKLGRKPTPTAAVIDSQSASTTQAGGPRGFDPGKRDRRALAGTKFAVPRINVAGQQMCAVCIGPRHHKRGHAHDVRRESSSYQLLNGFRGGNKNLAAEVSALFRRRKLIFKVHTRRARLNHPLHQFECV